MDRVKIASELVRLAKGLVAAKAIELVKSPGAMMERQPRYMIRLHGKDWGELYFNMRGYVAEKGIPVPSQRGSGAASLEIGEKGLSAFKMEIARANREWSDAGKTAAAKSLVAVYQVSVDIDVGGFKFSARVSPDDLPDLEKVLKKKGIKYNSRADYWD